LALFWYACILRLTISTLVLCKECIGQPVSLLILGSVFSDCVVFYGDYKEVARAMAVALTEFCNTRQILRPVFQ